MLTILWRILLQCLRKSLGGRKQFFYQIYPRSYSDNTNNGIGDLCEIINKIAYRYLPNLGIDVFWLSPIYPSPQEDFGYAIKDQWGSQIPFQDEYCYSQQILYCNLRLWEKLYHWNIMKESFYRSRKSNLQIRYLHLLKNIPHI